MIRTVPLRVGRQFFELDAHPRGRAVQDVGEQCRGFAVDFRAQVLGHLHGQRRRRFRADGQLRDQRFFAQQLEESLPPVERRGFEHKHRKRRRRFEILPQHFENFVARFFAELFNRLGFLDNQHLPRRKHRQSLRAPENLVPAGIAGGEPRHGPVARGFGNAYFDDFVAAHLAQIVIGAEQDHGCDRFPLREALDQFVGGNARHQKFSSTLDTRCDARSRDIRSSAGSCSSKNEFTSVEI